MICIRSQWSVRFCTGLNVHEPKSGRETRSQGRNTNHLRQGHFSSFKLPLIAPSSLNLLRMKTCAHDPFKAMIPKMTASISRTSSSAVWTPLVCAEEELSLLSAHLFGLPLPALDGAGASSLYSLRICGRSANCSRCSSLNSTRVPSTDALRCVSASSCCSVTESFARTLIARTCFVVSTTPKRLNESAI